LSRPPTRFTPVTPQFKVNGKIRAREVRVIGPDGVQVGILDLGAALTLARNHRLDLVEIAPTAVPPVCRIVDFGKFKYEQAKRERDAKKHQHANQVKEVQLTPRIDPHDLGIKLEHAVAFLCDDMKVKVALRFRGREMAHTEIGMGVVRKFIRDIAPWGHPDFDPKLVGRSINVMISPLPRGRRAADPSAPPAGKPASKTVGSGEKAKASASDGNSADGASTEGSEVEFAPLPAETEASEPITAEPGVETWSEGSPPATSVES
jgi:translation initiation factor IF-3